MAHQFILTMRDLRRVHPPDREVLRGINISMYPGAKIGVLGLNGAGKSTLLRIIAGEDDGYQGECRVTPGFSVGFLPQEPHLDPAKDVLGNVVEGVSDTKDLLDRFEEVCTAMGEPDADFDKLLAEQSELQDKIDHVNGWDLDRQLEIAMDALRLPNATADVTKLSGGERRRVALCRLLLRRPDLLLLDEPTNHLDPESIEWVAEFLENFGGTFLVVTHDRYFLDRVAADIVELCDGKFFRHAGNYTDYLLDKAERQAADAVVEHKRQMFLKRELAWVRQGPRAQRSKAKNRFDRYYETAAQDGPVIEEDVELVIPPPPQLG
ncbi:MAG TPA: ATP-binding cassette domain-containing protein, partial [Acidimicrobiia bacterium]|nr:ATP-binding cassette domain-containing protein [Acidimicrobiia bacterium]